MENRKEFISYIESVSLFLLGILFLALPVIFTTFTTEAFVLPKQIIVGVAACISLILWGTKTIATNSVRLRRTPFDLAIILFVASAVFSAIFSINRFDSLIAVIPLVFAGLLFFIIGNIAQDKKSVNFLVSALIGGGVIASIISILSFFKIYLLPFQFTHVQSFTSFGSLLEQAIYLGLLLPLAGYSLVKIINNTKATNVTHGIFAVASIIILMGLSVSIYQLVFMHNLLVLPLETGFQTAFAAISQDTGRIGQGFLLGSGFGTYVTDFTRFKQIAFNQSQTLWNLTFVKSSSFLLEILATAGILGFLSFIFLFVKAIKEIKSAKFKKENPIWISVALAFIVTLVLPISFAAQSLIFILLGILGAMSENVFDVEFHLVALRKGLISPTLTENISPTHSDKSKILPFVFSFIALAVIAFVGFWSVKYIVSDLRFQESLVAAAGNNGGLTYQKQTSAINLFPYKDSYYRIFAQTNLALANSLAAQTPRNSSPSAQTQQTITTLIQQSINSGRNATTLSPLNTLNWQNLSSIYRSLIGFGQNAESFAIATQQQAALLDPNNPQEYIALGGIYYQLKQWDSAQNQFQLAANLKPDFANAYYNIGHTLEQKGDIQNAIRQLEVVKTLVASNADNLKIVNAEIDALQKKSSTNPEASSSLQKPLGINTPSTTLPPQNPPVKIPAPNVATESSR